MTESEVLQAHEEEKLVEKARTRIDLRQEPGQAELLRQCPDLAPAHLYLLLVLFLTPNSDPDLSGDISAATFP